MLPSPTPLQLTAVLGAVLLAAALARLYHLAFHRRPYPGIPHNPASARRLLGDLPALAAEARRRGDPARATLAQFARLRSPVVQLFPAPLLRRRRPLVFVGDARDFDRSPGAVAPFRPLVPGASICKVRGPVWRAQVRLWTDVISVGFLRDVAAPAVHRTALALADLFRAKVHAAGGRPFWVAEDFKIATFDVIWKVMLGADLGGVSRERDAVLAGAAETTALPRPAFWDEPADLATASKSAEWDAAVYFLSLVPATLVSPIPGVLHFLYSLTPTWRRHWATKERLMKELIESSRARFADLGDLKHNESVAEKRDVCALDRALRRFAKVSPANVYRPTTKDMYDELFLLLMSGHETTATLLAWTVKILTNSQAEQTKLRDALRAHFPPSPTDPDVKAILAADVPYLDASVEELLRVGNIIPEVVREATADTELLGHRIPKGATVVCSTYVADRPFGEDVIPEEVRSPSSRANKGGCRTYWEADMDGYHPERWLREDGSFDAKAVPMLAFSAGPRACFGRKFAIQQFRIMLVVLTMNFEFLPIPDGLNSDNAFSKLTRSPCQCYVRINPI